MRKTASKVESFPKAYLGPDITVHATGQGAPWLRLSDGREVVTAYSGPGPLTQLLEQNQAQPRALASADFDEDGAPDLICGYEAEGNGVITLLRGNVDAIYQNAPEALERKANGSFTDAPFLSPALVYAVQEPADFVGAGDFDGDSHWDVVTAARGGNRLRLLSGDGHGGFSAPGEIELPGGLTAMVVGEINRRDGLDDVVVGVKSEDRAQVLVFDGPRGALRATPEIFIARATVSGLALGQFDDEYPIDLAVAAGSKLMIVHGRDRKLSLNENRPAEAPPAQITRRNLSFAIKAMEAGDFIGHTEDDLALLANDGALYVLSAGAQEVAESNKQVASNGLGEPQRLGDASWPGATSLLRSRITGSPHDDLTLVDASTRRLHVIPGYSPENGSAMVATRFNTDASSRAAISLQTESEPIAALKMRLNRHARHSLVLLFRDDSNPSIVSPASGAVLTVTTTADSGPGSLREAVILANKNPDTDTIEFRISRLQGRGNQTISLLTALPEIKYPVIIDGTTQSAMPCRFCNSLVKPLVELSGNTTFDGLIITASDCVVRGLVINRFKNGISLQSDNNRVEGNYIGTDVSGKRFVGNLGHGVHIIGGISNIVGGTSPSSRNVISANTLAGVAIEPVGSEKKTGGSKNLVQGNYIGSDVSGAVRLPNGCGDRLPNCEFEATYFSEGIHIDGSHNTIGGTIPGARNVISGNRAGIALNVGECNIVQGNFIGTNADGNKPLGNFFSGIFFTRSPNNTVGGTVEAARNVISSNGSGGVYLSDLVEKPLEGLPPSKNNILQGNYIGLDKDGVEPLGNKLAGISIVSLGTTSVVGNVISATIEGYGISLGGGGKDITTKGTLIRDNLIGPDKNGNVRTGLGNQGGGIFVDNEAFEHTIEDNTIAFNSGLGVFITEQKCQDCRPGALVKITQNRIFANGGLGIALCQPNGIGDTNCGANDNQRPPIRMNITTAGGQTTFRGTLTGSKPNSPVRIELFEFDTADQSSSSAHVSPFSCKPLSLPSIALVISDVTNSNGNLDFNVTFPSSLTGGFVNATATTLLSGEVISNTGNTSEYSDCVKIRPPGLVVRELTALPDRIVAKAFAVIGKVTLFISDEKAGKDVGFELDAEVRQDADGNVIITQTGKLKDGRSIDEAIPRDTTVRIKFLDGNGGLTEVLFRR